MHKQPTEEELKAMAAQLRKPEGKAGIETGNFMNDGNLAMNLHSIAALNPKENESILEVGMGNGVFVKNIIGADRNIKYTGLDYSQLMVDESVKNNRSFIEKGIASFHCGNIQEMPFAAQSFDAVFTINTFYFWEDADAVLQEVKRVLKPGGRFVLSARPHHVMTSIPLTKYNFALWKDNEILELLKKEGFEAVFTTNIQEPEIEKWGEKFRLETLVFDCRLSS